MENKKDKIEPFQPLDLNQLVMQRTGEVGTNTIKEDNRITALLHRILWTWVKDNNLRSELRHLPKRMNRKEARSKLRRERGGAFPLAQEVMSFQDGSMERLIEEDYYYRLLDDIGKELYDLKKQGILNWGVDVGGEPAGVYLEHAKGRK